VQNVHSYIEERGVEVNKGFQGIRGLFTKANHMNSRKKTTTRGKLYPKPDISKEKERQLQSCNKLNN
jgi:hypothetical protein